MEPYHRPARHGGASKGEGRFHGSATVIGVQILRCDCVAVAGLLLAGCGGDDGSSTSGAASGDASGAGPDVAPTTALRPSTTATVQAGIVGTARLNLNTAAGNEFSAKIPNFPSNMVREFLEYRPYVSIQQFRREIGKYVSKEEVARLERYVTVN